MHSGILNVLTDSICHNLTILSHSVHFHFLGVLDELAHHYRLLFRYIGSQFQEAFQLFLIGADIHGRTTQHIRGTYQNREAYLVNKGMDVFHRSQCAPFGLIHSDAVQHGREFIPVFGIVNALGTGTEDIYILRIQTESQIIRNLATGRYNDSVRILQLENIHHTLESQLVKVQTEVEKGRDVIEAAIVAAHLRFRPIVMTSLAFILGLLPLVFASGPGSASRQGIGTGVFFGMLVAISVGIVFVPFFFVWIYRIKEKMKR